jgi:6-phosphogluconolactonase
LPSIRPAGGSHRPRPFPSPTIWAYLSLDRSGHYLFGASYFGNKISVNAINTDGEINPKPLSVTATGKNAHCIRTDLSNKFLFVSNLGSDVIVQCRFDETTGNIVPNEPSVAQTRKGAGPRHFVFHPNRRLLFCTNELDGTVSAYRLEAAGTLTPLDSSSAMPPHFQGGAPATADLHFTPDGRFLYVTERTSSTIAAFRVDGENGKLTLIESYPTETQPRGFNIDPGGKYLLVVGQKSNGLSICEIDQKDGTLRKLSHLDVGKNPNWVEIIALPD